MRVNVVVVCFLFVSINLHANENWISLEPTKQNNDTKKENNLKQQLPVAKMFAKVKIIHHLLDKTGSTQPSQESKKKWFTIKNMEK